MILSDFKDGAKSLLNILWVLLFSPQNNTANHNENKQTTAKHSNMLIQYHNHRRTSISAK